MRVLHVEDKSDFAERFSQFIRAHAPSIALHICTSFNGAVGLMGHSDFDAVVLDLAIPRDDDGAPLVEIGAELARIISRDYPGTLVLILTGQRDEPESEDLLYEIGRRVRFLGGSERPYLSVWRKDRFEKVFEILKALEEEELVAGSVPLSNMSNGALGNECSLGDRRILKGFCLYRGGAQGRVKRLGGLSGSAVYRLDVIDESGAVVQRSVGKIGGGHSVDLELSNYNNMVTRLPNGYPPAISVDIVGGGKRRAAFYNLAVEFDAELFSLVDPPSDVATLIRRKLANWHDSRRHARCSVRQIVLEVGGERALQLLLESGIARVDEVLNLDVQHYRSLQHGDLHGANVLCKQDATDVCMIDFGDVGESIGTLDVVTLELSPFFHPSSSGQAHVVALREYGQRWFEEETLESAGFPPWLLALRRWARESSHSHMEYAAAVLAYSARQLKYADTDHDLALVLIRAALDQLLDQ